MEQTATDILTMLTNMSKTYPAIMTLMEAVAYVGGFFIALFGVLRYRHGKNLGVGIGTSTLVSIAVGVALINAPMVIASISETLFANSDCMSGVPAKFYDYMTAADCSASSNYLKPVILFIQFYGFFAFLRGFFLVNRAHKVGMGSQSDDIALKGWMHVLFGFLCIYIVDVTRFAFTTLGFETLSNFLK